MKQYLDRVHNAVQRRPALSENKLVFQALAHSAAIAKLSQGYEQIMQLMPKAAAEAPDEMARTKSFKDLRVMLGALKQQSDKHGMALSKVTPMIEKLAADDSLKDEDLADQKLAPFAPKLKEFLGGPDDPWDPAHPSVLAEQMPSPGVQPAPLAAIAQAQEHDEAGYEKIEHKLDAMQSHLQNRIVSLKQEEQKEQNAQVQQLDALMTHPEPLGTIPLSLEQTNATVAVDDKGKITSRAFRGAQDLN